VSGNSSSQGASGMAYPYMPGYEITWDANTREWVARRGDIELRGRNQDELDKAQKAVKRALASDLSAVPRDPPDDGDTAPSST
jgi:hypothetical protein